MNILYIIDKNLERLYSSIKSVSYSTIKSITFHIITKSESSYLPIKINDKIKYYFYDNNNDDYINDSHIKTYANTIFKLGEILPQNIKQILYIDFDIYFFNYSLDEIFKRNRSKIHMNKEFGSQQYNSGFILINDLNYFKYKTNIKINNDLFDQDVLNHIFKNDICDYHDKKINFTINKNNLFKFYKLPKKCILHTILEKKIWNENNYFLFEKIRNI